MLSLPQKTSFLTTPKVCTNNECCSGPKTNNCLAAKLSEIKKSLPHPFTLPPTLKQIISRQGHHYQQCEMHCKPCETNHTYWNEYSTCVSLISPQAFYSLHLNEAS
ncbi:unnamed protein product [Sphagnum troendelagicum]|uniref:Uncharacterized protein n=1 Tax=Sphagnum troendelagicum TaxID=128251 RepID=A0ABP0T9L9_9BRYO